MERVGRDVVARMMNDPNQRIRETGDRLFALSVPGEAIRKGKQHILRYIEDLQAKDHAVFRNAHWHLKNFGPWAVRFLVPVLGKEVPDEFRSRVILVLTEMGTEASLALVEALDSASVLLKQNAAIVLGNIKDERALPALKRVLEDPNEPPEVKKFAHEALLKITRKAAAEWKKATDYYFELAEKYAYSHPGVILTWDRAHLVWRWDKSQETLLEREVPRFAYNEQLAEEALYDLLALDPNYVHGPTGAGAWALLACVHMAQAIEAEASLYAAEQAVKNGQPGLLPDHVENLKKLVDRYNRHNVSGKIPGRAYLYEALARSLKDYNAPVARELILTLQEMARPDDLPGAAVNGGAVIGAPLIEALTDSDKRVRYAAAEAMARINPPQRKLGMELVIPALVDALGEQGVRVALVIYDVQDDNDRNFVNGLKRTLASINVFPIVAGSGIDGIIKAKQFPTEDVIILQRKVASQIYFRETEVRRPVVETVFDTLRDDVRTKNIPRVLLCDGRSIQDDKLDEQARIDKELADSKQQYDQTAQGFIKKDAHKLDVQALLDTLFDTPEAQKDAKDRADQLARSAAETLAGVDPANTLYPFRDAVDALIKTVGTEILREDFIRIPGCRALGHFADQRALGVLAKIVNDKAEGDADKIARQKPVRMAAAKAMSEIFKNTGVEPAPEIYDVLKKNLLDGDIDIELLCGEALGNAKLTNEQRLETHLIRRINDKAEYRPARTPEDE
ncbi:MAG: HEAT repeat domain-containing protein [Planctomycetes bacterium]|nr:HEAT repeat domain-containing protein [Planctomycetota bacterium]